MIGAHTWKNPQTGVEVLWIWDDNHVGWICPHCKRPSPIMFRDNHIFKQTIRERCKSCGLPFEFSEIEAEKIRECYQNYMRIKNMKKLRREARKKVRNGEDPDQLWARVLELLPE